MKTLSDKLGEYNLYKEFKSIDSEYAFKLETMDDLLKRDEQRQKDGFK
jgi:hypothetical protein